METLPQMIVTALQLVGAFLLMRWFDPRLAWALLLLTPVAIVLGKLVSRKLRNMTLAIRERESKIQMQVQEGVEHNVLMRSLESENWVAGRLGDMQQHLESDVLRRTRFTTLSRFALGSAFGLGYLLAFIWGGLGLRDGAITFGMMTSFLQLVGQIQHPILSILNMVPQVVHTTASIDRLEDLEKSKEPEGDGTPMALEGSLGVRLENLHFGYAAGRHEVLEGFSHDFEPGSKTAIMGKTGAGKTTLFRLLLGFVRPDSGRMLVYSSSEVCAIGKETRTNFVYVPQGNTLLSGSVRLNLQLAKPDASEQEMLQALHAACADFVLDLPDGLDTEIGERGRGLSEGQAQRIGIARGLLRPGNVWLFDEVSSSLDESTERELFERLFATYPDKTMIFVTHRSAMSEICDEVVRL
jgi:ABC-type multidrug transport system fused ATPase/permease subunit